MTRVIESGDVVVLVPAGTEIEPSAVDRLAHALQAAGADLAYADEVQVAADGTRTEFRKPVWSPERLRCQPYLGVTALARTVYDDLGGLDEGYGPAALHDLQLRAAERDPAVVHVAEALSVAPAPERLADQHRQAVQAHLGRLGLKATAAVGAAPGILTISRELDPACRVSIVVPTNGSSGTVWGRPRVLVLEALKAALGKTRHENLEVVVVYDTPSTPAAVRDELRSEVGDRLVLVPYAKPFDHSEKCNLGVLYSTGDRIVLFNDDVEAISDRWLEELVAPLDEQSVGLTGAKLYLENTRVQHAGHAYAGGDYHHVFYRALREDEGPHQALVVNREVSGVTAAVAAIRRETYLEVGGFSALLPTSYNDIDLCHKVRHAGYRIVWLAGVELYHFQSLSRGRQPTEAEQVARRPVLARWGAPVEDDYLPAGAR